MQRFQKACSKINKNVALDTTKKLLDRIADASDIPRTRLSPHVLRHSFATHMINNGADINSVKEILGHSSLTSTQIYTKIKVPKMLNDYMLNHPREKR